MVVAGLAELLDRAKLAEHHPKAEVFCVEVGAVHVREILEDNDLVAAFVEAVGLKKLELRRFESVTADMLAQPAYDEQPLSYDQGVPSSPVICAASSSQQVAAATKIYRPGRAALPSEPSRSRTANPFYENDESERNERGTASVPAKRSANPFFASDAADGADEDGPCEASWASAGRNCFFDAVEDDGIGDGGRPQSNFFDVGSERAADRVVRSGRCRGAGGRQRSQKSGDDVSAQDGGGGHYFSVESEETRESVRHAGAPCRAALASERGARSTTSEAAGHFFSSAREPAADFVTKGEAGRHRTFKDPGRQRQGGPPVGPPAEKNIAAPSQMQSHSSPVGALARTESVLDTLEEKRRQDDAALAQKREAARLRRRQQDDSRGGDGAAGRTPLLTPGHAQRRVDPDDKHPYSYEELQRKYAGEYSSSEIAEYWRTLKPLVRPA